ncbi:lipase/acyltransferase domain-containing protein [Nitrospira sp. BLG_1]|uniref:lipase/acyltransferase domain-containing protein n=1 Tax=Nitrospira sp. BLG_1 TaxID=3395883 RepID=UPI0039BC86E1
MAKSPMRDMIIVLPGITGSVLVDEDGEEMWNVSGKALWSYLHSFGKNLDKLVVPSHPPGSDAPSGGVRATGLVQGLHGVFGLGRIDGYSGLTAMIRNNFDVVPANDDLSVPANYVEFPYDWRLSNRFTAARLKALVDTRLPVWQRSAKGGQEAKIILIAHSMGGLVSRYYLEKLEGWQTCRALITLGTPYRGSVNAIDYLVNGYKKVFHNFTEAMRSMPSVYELLPIWQILENQGNYKRVAEADDLPHIIPARAQNALAFHREIEESVERHQLLPEYLKNSYRIIPIVGIAQPTLQSVQITDGSLTASRRLPNKVDPSLDGGDGTVPELSATPIELSEDSRETFFAERHGSLQNNSYVLEGLYRCLKRLQVRGLKELRGDWADSVQRAQLSLDIDPLYLPGETVHLQARVLGQSPATLSLKARLEGVTVDYATREYGFQGGEDSYELTLEGLRPGSYRVKVLASEGGPNTPLSISETFEIAGKT